MKIYVCLLLICFFQVSCSKESSPSDSFLTSIAESILNLDGLSYRAVRKENETLATENSKVKNMKLEFEQSLQNALKAKDQDFEKALQTNHPPFVFIKAFKKNPETTFIQIDSCEIDSNEKPSDPVMKKETKLYVATEMKITPLTFEKFTTGKYDVCGDQIKRILWDYKGSSPNEGKIQLITNTSDVKIFPINMDLFAPYKLVAKDFELINEKSPLYIENKSISRSEQLKDCSSSKWGHLLYIECKGHSLLTYDHRVIDEEYASDNGYVSISGKILVTAEVIINGRTFFLTDSIGRRLNPVLGESVYELECSLPTMC